MTDEDALEGFQIAPDDLDEDLEDALEGGLPEPSRRFASSSSSYAIPCYVVAIPPKSGGLIVDIVADLYDGLARLRLEPEARRFQIVAMATGDVLAQSWAEYQSARAARPKDPGPPKGSRKKGKR